MTRRWMMLWLAALLAGGSASVAKAADRPAFEEHIVFTGVTYEDGTGNALQGVNSLFFDTHTSELYACVPSGHSISIYDENLVPRFGFEHYVTDRRSGKRYLGEPNAVTVVSDGDILVIDGLADYVDWLDFRGEPVEQLWLNKIYGDTNLSMRPLAMAQDENDNLYVLTGGDLTTIMVLNPDFTYKRRIGRKAMDTTDVEGFQTVVGMHVSEGKVYVADLYAVPAIKIFDTSGQYISGFGGHTVEKNDVTMVTGLATMPDSAGDPVIFSCDQLRQVIKVFDKTGQILGNIGGFGNSIGSVAYPSDIVSGQNNTFFISEKVGRRIQKFEVK